MPASDAISMNNPGLDLELGVRAAKGLTPSNTRVALLGDSIPYGNSFQLNSSIKTYIKGYANWAAYLGRQRWTFDHNDNFGIPGDNTNDLIRRVDAALAATTAGTIILDCSTNDATNGVSVAQTKANYATLVAKILAAGRVCVCITPRPRDITSVGLTMTSSQYRDLLARRDYILGLHNPGIGIYVVDMWRYLADPASANGAMRAGFSYDGTHPAVPGGYWGGLALAELFGLGRADGLFPFYDVLPGQNTDVFNATYPRGCLNSNPMMQGGATAATGYTVGSGSGVTATGSKVSPAGGRTDIQQIVLGGNASANADVFDFYQVLASANLAVGDVIEAYAEVDYDSMSGIAAHGLGIVDTSDFLHNAYTFSDSTDINALQMPSLAVSGVMRTPKFTVTSTTTVRVGMKARTINGQAVAGTYRLGALAVRKAA